MVVPKFIWPTFHFSGKYYHKNLLFKSKQAQTILQLYLNLFSPPESFQFPLRALSPTLDNTAVNPYQSGGRCRRVHIANISNHRICIINSQIYLLSHNFLLLETLNLWLYFLTSYDMCSFEKMSYILMF